jgi:hypothetical protein
MNDTQNITFLNMHNMIHIDINNHRKNKEKQLPQIFPPVLIFLFLSTTYLIKLLQVQVSILKYFHPVSSIVTKSCDVPFV